MEAKYKIVNQGPGNLWYVYIKEGHGYYLHGVRDSFAEARQLVYKMVQIEVVIRQRRTTRAPIRQIR